MRETPLATDKLESADPGDNIEVAVVPNFPRFDINQLRRYTCGVYQLKQAESYTQEHMNAKGQYLFSIHKEAGDLIRVRIQSRHTGSVQYWAWIEYSLEVTGSYCTCSAGMRTVGCCAHVASVVWFLSYARHCDYVFSKSPVAFHIFDANGTEFDESGEN
eukprot:Pompholyxophrys_punicea_v1_NODE_135_length_3273_cov_11.162523.p3 type:complete len:160 gc:universal NODE_135_length_3273_cov_11.162523:2494-2973(+)